ncbi:ATP-binding protein [Stieleria sp. TO1_6]|uniref:ATP-binding protein n=1 Tax=Stieleria tagensis TaxID=2956795 RepID=UPI00209AAADF|nr:ATP-binding protein [Stieleria tagensis]MCO8124890.1 ATP-binding protein [Stieleria tagensis]
MHLFKLNVKTRISLGLICVLLSVLSLAMFLGLVPAEESAIRAGRANLCEVIALTSSDLISHRETRRLERFLESVVERNPAVISAGIRRTNGALVSVFGDHKQAWSKRSSQHSTGTHVQVPIRSGTNRWGVVELCFAPLRPSHWSAKLMDPWIVMTAFVCLVSFVLFQLYLKKMLAHLDPSKTVPKRVRSALDSLAEGLLVLDRQGRIVLANQSFSDWIGCDPDRLLGRKADRLDWKLDSLHQAPWQTALSDDVVIAGAMIELCLPNHPPRMLIANASPVLGHDGKSRGVLVSFDDVTQLEETKRDLTIAKRVADDANQAKSEFLARMSHEIRTPMNAILGYTDVLRRGFDTSIQDRQEYLDTIHGSGEHLLALINDILDLSKVESGQMELSIEPCSPYKIIKDVVNLLRPRADEKAISLAFRNQGLLPKLILGDAMRLRQAVMNLAGNAIKFTEHGGVEIVARIDQPRAPSNSDLAAADQTFLAIDVIDTGIGISPDALAKVFDPFTQADTSITRRFGGTGLGLAISKQLAEAMGGRITVSSTPGKGTTFTIHVAIGPLNALELIDPIDDPELQTESQSPTTKVQQLPACRILVAEDGSPNRKLLRLILGQAGVNVTTVENGQLAVAAATKEPFDIVLMDMHMPVMDGYTATAKLRESGYTQPIIALTANAMQGDQEKCFAAGCSGFLTKPIKIDTLLAKLAEVLGSLPPTSNPVDAASIDTHPQLPVRCSHPLEDIEFLEIADGFVQALGLRFPAMERALQAEQFESLANDAHWLKGTCGNAGFDVFFQPAADLQRFSLEHQISGCQLQMKQIKHIASRIDLASQIAASPAKDLFQDSSRSEQTATPIDSAAQASGPIESTLPMEDPEFREIVLHFLERLEIKLREMHQAFDNQDWTELGLLAHWLRGTSGSLGFDQFVAPTHSLERSAEQQDESAMRRDLHAIVAIASRIVVPVAEGE